MQDALNEQSKTRSQLETEHEKAKIQLQGSINAADSHIQRERELQKSIDEKDSQLLREVTLVMPVVLQARQERDQAINALYAAQREHTMQGINLKWRLQAAGSSRLKTAAQAAQDTKELQNCCRLSLTHLALLISRSVS